MTVTDPTAATRSFNFVIIQMITDRIGGSQNLTTIIDSPFRCCKNCISCNYIKDGLPQCNFTSNGDGLGTLNLTIDATRAPDATLKTTMIMSQLVNLKKFSDPSLFYAFGSTERTPSLATSSTSKFTPSINYHSVNYQTLAVIGD